MSTPTGSWAVFASKRWRRLKRKFKTTSGPRLLLELINWIALTTQPLLAGFLAWKKSSTGEGMASLALVLAVIYAGLYKWVLSDLFKTEKLGVEDGG